MSDVLLFHHFRFPVITLQPKSFLFLTPEPTAQIPLRGGPVKRANIKCAAYSRRQEMVAKQIHREIADMLSTDDDLQCAVQPEARFGADRSLSLTTITDVEISADLKIAKAYVWVVGDEREKEFAISGLKSKAKYVRRELGKRMRLRHTPLVRFIEDDSIERGIDVIDILDRLKAEREAAEAQDMEQYESSDADKDGIDLHGDDDDSD